MSANAGVTQDIRVFTDQLGRRVEVPFPPRRIVSLVPSQTELLFDLGLEEEVAGITWFCIHPADKLKGKTKIGGTKNVKLDKVRALQPDLIIANKEENTREDVEALMLEYPVWVSDIGDLSTSLAMIRGVGDVCNRVEEAPAIADNILYGFEEMPKAGGQRTLYLIWREHYMSIGNDTFIHYTLDLCGLQNVSADKTRYPELSHEEIARLKPELILLSSEPYPFKEKHMDELRDIVPEAEIRLVDGEMFSWYGSRLTKAHGYLKDFIQSL